MTTQSLRSHRRSVQPASNNRVTAMRGLEFAVCLPLTDGLPSRRADVAKDERAAVALQVEDDKSLECLFPRRACRCYEVRAVRRPGRIDDLVGDHGDRLVGQIGDRDTLDVAAFTKPGGSRDGHVCSVRRPVRVGIIVTEVARPVGEGIPLRFAAVDRRDGDRACLPVAGRDRDGAPVGRPRRAVEPAVSGLGLNTTWGRLPSVFTTISQ